MYKQSNPEKVKESQKRVNAAYKQRNLEKVKESQRRANVAYKQSNSEKRKKKSKHPGKFQPLYIAYRQNHPENYKVSQKKQYLKRNLATSENETDLGLSKHKRCKCNPESQINMSESIALFHKNINVGPEYICTCCEQLWYKPSVTKCNPDLYKSCSREILNLYVTTGIKSIDDTEWICSTCHSNLKSGKLPSCAKANKMTFPEKPDVLKNLTPLEERLISPRIPFMQVRELPSGGQLSIYDQENNDEEWSEFSDKDKTETSGNLSNNLNTQDQKNVQTQTCDISIDNDTDDEWCEETERPSGVMDTLLQEPDITQHGDRIISFAPGEGNRPLGLFIDKDSEFLSFPTIYCGKRRTDNSERLVPVHYSTICKWDCELGNPTWFCSISAAETRWIHLIKILGRLIDHKDYTDDEIKGMTWQKKSELIQKDPVTCARNFEHMVQLFIHNFIKSSNHPIGEVIDFFYRVEFQQRGSPHIHGLFWIKNAPEYGKDSDDYIAKFVNSYV
ncbi:Hypothetical predicted protein [Paramuricea clavata]|uniref:Uncharacterized protein n=1 Tax=Paramuricea clavata TaxID=317549 RepID=A0A7D9IK14_PARCT|nr:Hypothetical predicted protein [Paramuricea clavata]